MLVGMRGALLSHTFAEERLLEVFEGRLGEDTRPAGHRALVCWLARCGSRLGPTSSLRVVFDAACALVECLGFDVCETAAISESSHGARLRVPNGSVGLVVVPWGDELDRSWRQTVTHAVVVEARWCLCFNGCRIRLVDARRSYSRAYLEFELQAILNDRLSFSVFWATMRAGSFANERHDAPTLVDQIREQSANHADAVCRSLRIGVREALIELLGAMLSARSRRSPSRRTTNLDSEFDQALTLIYRLLFLLFAEARGLVPLWHPVYRRSYTLEALREAVEQGDRTPGLWESLQAISRLAHEGCRAGSLEVTAFNGRLFAPEHAPLVDRLRLDDRVVGRVMVALSTRAAGPQGRQRIAYRDLGVEQLGAVYESVLDYRPEVTLISGAHEGRPATQLNVAMRSTRIGRKTSGTFYTPRSITDFLVRRTLHPLVAEASSESLLTLRVVDPAMGSGAFLVSACRYLAAAYERAVVREGRLASDITDEDRAGFRRLIAQRCLFGVDLNPTAVHLARLSIWLATLAADRPLTFLDHHLVAGNSLVGAGLEDVARRPPPGGKRRARRHGQGPLFDASDAERAVREVLPERLRVALEPDDSPAVVRAKEKTLERLRSPSSSLTRWKRIADLWCACWFWPLVPAPDRAVFGELLNATASGSSILPAPLSSHYLASARQIADERRFFHWSFEFPEAFYGKDGRPLPSGGFDAVVGNPPWDVFRADTPDGSVLAEDVARTTRFLRDSGVYASCREGHANSYQLFVERALRLLRPGGRLGFVVPWGLASDAGSRDLRRRLLERCDTDMLVSFSNRRRIFPIHRDVRILLVTSTAGSPTRVIACRFGEDDPSVLDAIPDTSAEDSSASFPVGLTPALIRRLSGEQLAIPHLRTSFDLRLHERISSVFPQIGAADGWALRFGRELNATDDRPALSTVPRGLTIVEGKQIRPFHVDLALASLWIDPSRAAERIDPSRSFRRARLAYRDVAGATNRLTLIAAILPPGTLTTHTVFCLKTDLDLELQHYLCGMFNSYVANYLIRARVTQHVSVEKLDRLPVPRVDRTARDFQEVVRLTSELQAARGEDPQTHARLQATAAALYGLTRAEFVHVLATFPLVPESDRTLAIQAFDRGLDQAFC